MKVILKIEEIFQLILAAYLAMQLPYPGWWYWALFLTPDIGMLGYLMNSQVGAISYNLFHHKGVALGIYLAGLLMTSIPLQFTGLLLFGHSAFDRALGYGLKYSDSFKNTHLGLIGKTS
jgi:hypothetical protein